MTAPSADSPVYRARDLLHHLLSTQRPGQYFRGQDRLYPPPLWPSAYRPYARSADSLSLDKAHRLRRVGKKFVLQLNFLEWEAFESKAKYEKFVGDYEVRHYVASIIRNGLGYPLAEAFMQQIGLRSEGLDVTTDPLIAFFFATHEFHDNRYRQRSAYAEPAVIFRWTLPTQRKWTVADLNTYDFNTCPAVIPTVDILSLFATSVSESDVAASIDRYRKAIGWGLGFDRSAIAGRRPFHILMLPEMAVMKSRVARQKAALLLPDVVRSSDFFQAYRVSSPEVRAEIETGLFVEDLAASDALEVYRFDASTVHEISELRDVSSDSVFPRSDFLFLLLRGWVRTHLANPYGIVPFQIGGPRNWSSILPDLLNDWETRLFV